MEDLFLIVRLPAWGKSLRTRVSVKPKVHVVDFRGLTQLRDALGPRFTAGIILTTGKRSYTYADRLHVMPIDRLWTPATAESMS